MRREKMVIASNTLILLTFNAIIVINVSEEVLIFFFFSRRGVHSLCLRLGIWGIGKNGYECGDCKFVCHKKCVAQVSKTCAVRIEKKKTCPSSEGFMNLGSSGECSNSAKRFHRYDSKRK